MNNKNKYIEISVFLYAKGFVPAGVITFNDINTSFTYLNSYIEADLPPINPSSLNWREHKQKHFIVSPNNKHRLDRTFWELLPNDNDWSNLVLLSRFPEYAHLNYVEKLYFLGSRKVGGLSSQIKDSTEEYSIKSLDWLDDIRRESIEFFHGNIEKIKYIKAVQPMTSYGGARPKCMFEDNEGDFWIAKFNLPEDPYDMAIAEHTALDISRDFGLPTSESKILKLESGENVFLSKRFDRINGSRSHSLSLFSLVSDAETIKKNPNIPGNPAKFIQTLMKRFSDFENVDCLNIVVKMLLDIGVNNTDNHLRNLRIILNKNNKWELSPIYDVVFNPNNQYHTYNPAGLALNELYINNPNLSQALSNELGIKEHIISDKINKIIPVLNNWESYCDKNGMTIEDKNKIGNAINLGLNRKEYTPKIINKNDNKIILTNNKQT